MKKLQPYLYCVALVLILGNVSCKKIQDAQNSTESFKASFTIYEPFYDTPIVYSTDTIVSYRAAFGADEDYTTYNWIVGSDTTTHRTKSFVLNFPIQTSGTTLPVRLIATKNDQRDTVVKAFTILGLKGTSDENLTPYCVELPYLGRFEGNYEDAPAHKFIVTIANMDRYPGSGSFRGFRIFKSS